MPLFKKSAIISYFRIKQNDMHVKGDYIYIMSNKNRTVLYIGVTNNLFNRVNEHRSGEGSAFTKKYSCFEMVYFEYFYSIEEAISREKQLKNWKRSWKDELIREMNSELKDLSGEIEEYR